MSLFQFPNAQETGPGRLDEGILPRFEYEETAAAAALVWWKAAEVHDTAESKTVETPAVAIDLAGDGANVFRRFVQRRT